MKLWSRIDEREDGSHALVFFKRIVVETVRGQTLMDIPIVTVETKKVKELPEAVDLELDVKPEQDGTISIFGKAKATTELPKDPKVQFKKFDDPESERAKKAKKMRGMGRFVGKEDASKPIGSGATPPVPREQRVGGRGRIAGRRKKGTTGKAVNRGGAVRGASRTSGKKKS